MTRSAKLGADGESYETRVRKSALKARLLGFAAPAVAFGDYDLERVVGKGASGVVFRARDRRLHRTVALKLLWAPPGSRRASTLDEARALAKVSHPNIVAVYEAGEFEACAFIAMEFVQGQSLRAWMNEEHDAAARLDILRQAAAGLASLHAANIVHGDIKPENALVGEDGRLRIVDFGLSSGDTSVAPVEAAGLGTWTYMAPEIRRGGPHSVRSDQFALCRVGKELVLDAPSRPAAPSIEAALRRGLESSAALRFSSMAALCTALQPPPARRRSVWIAAGAGSGAVAALAMVLSGLETEPPTCSGHLLVTDRSRAVLEQALAASAEPSRTLAEDEARLARRAASFLALGRWEEGCAFIEETLRERADHERLRCMQAAYCSDRTSLPRRALCFGGDLQSCQNLAIVHEYEFLDALQAAPPGGDAGLELHRAMLLEAATEGCALGDTPMCELARRTAVAD